MNISLVMLISLVAGLGAGLVDGQRAGGDVAIEDPNIAPPPTLRGMWDVSPIVIVARVVPNDSQKPDADGGLSRGVRDSRFYTYTVRPIEIIKGSGLGESLKVIVPRTSATGRWSPGDEYLLFLKRTSERGTYQVTSASWYMLDQGLFIIPELVRNSYFGGRAKIPKDELLAKIRQMR